MPPSNGVPVYTKSEGVRRRSRVSFPSWFPTSRQEKRSRPKFCALSSLSLSRAHAKENKDDARDRNKKRAFIKIKCFYLPRRTRRNATRKYHPPKAPPTWRTRSGRRPAALLRLRTLSSLARCDGRRRCSTKTKMKRRPSYSYRSLSFYMCLCISLSIGSARASLKVEDF